MSDNEDKTIPGHITRREAIQTTVIAGAAMSTAGLWTGYKSLAAPAATILDPRFSQPVLNPTQIAKFVDSLPVPGSTWPVIDLTPPNSNTTTIFIKPLSVQILPSPMGLSTPVWAYRGDVAYTSTYLGPTLKVQGGVPTGNVPTVVNYNYSQVCGATACPITEPHLLKIGIGGSGTASVVDLHVHGTDGNPPEPQVRFIAHLHGARGVAPTSDGYTEAWVTPNGTTGSTPPDTRPPTTGAVQTHTYPNAQQAALSWYHDHALGITRLNVYAGGAGGYIVTDANEQGLIGPSLPDPGIPLVVQDRMFYPDGRLAYPDLPAPTAALIATPGCTTPWPTGDVSTRPEYFGDVIVVNGKTWPFLAVDPKIYRFRFLNGCNSRVLDLSFDSNLNFSIIGTEGGFLPGPSVVRKNLVMGGAERFDVLVDFRGFAGKILTLLNKGAKKPFPKGKPPNPQSDGLVMQFRVGTGSPGPSLLSPTTWSDVTLLLSKD